jgi:hypothetical protein
MNRALSIFIAFLIFGIAGFYFAPNAIADSCPSNNSLTGYSKQKYLVYVAAQTHLEQSEPRMAKQILELTKNPVDTIPELIRLRNDRIQAQLSMLDGFARSSPTEYRCHQELLDQQYEILAEARDILKTGKLAHAQMLPWTDYEAPALFRIE